MNDVLLILRRRQCDQHCSAVGPVIYILFCDSLMDGRIKCWPPSVRPSVRPIQKL